MRNFVPVLALALLSLACIEIPRNADANPEHDAVVSVAQNYMNAYYTGNVARMQKALHPDFHKRTLKTVDGRVLVTEDTVSSMLEGARVGGRDIPESERVKKIEVLDIYKNAANVKVVTGGWVDYMLLSKSNGEWRVLDVVLQYTR